MTEREEIIERLRDVKLSEYSGFNVEHVMAAICGHDIYEEWTLNECKQLRDKLINLLTFMPTVPTVESVLAEFADEWIDVPPYREPEIIAKYTAKLRLVSDAE